ncbi:MAG: GTPase Era [Xanthomonadales bacterium]|nr:GTPase Era [Xanthomonadales bacterium]
MESEQEHRCGYAAIVGRPNVGKSTLLNAILGQKVSITASKPQTTRHQILGIKSVEGGQLVFIDTPGIHQGTPKAINRYMNRVARAVLADADVVLWVVEAARLTEEDRALGESLKSVDAPVLCIINKIDRLRDKRELLPFLEQLNRDYRLAEVLPVCALESDGVDVVEAEVLERLPFSRPFYDADQITDRSERFLAAEFVREQITRCTHEEVPYATTVEVENYVHEEGLVRIGILIWVEREGQKAIIIGRKGETLRKIGSRARKALEALLGEKVFLQTWVKVKQGWSDDERALRAFGYQE